MAAKVLHQGILPFKIEKSDEPLIARAGLLLPYEMAGALKLPQVIDRELPAAGSGHGYKPSQIEAEKAGAQWTYKKDKGYQPLLGFLFELGLALGDEFRDGNVPAGARAMEFLDFCVQMMPKGKRIRYYRSDSAAYQAVVINYCFSHDMLFTITADQDEAVKETIKNIKPEEWHPYQKDREIAETVHTMNQTREAFRLIVPRWPKLQGELFTLTMNRNEFNPDPYCYHLIATNRQDPAKDSS